MSACFTRLFAIVRKEVQQLRRDRLTFAMIVGIPILQILLFGYAIDTDVRHLRAAVVDQSQTQLSRRLLADAESTQVVDIVAHADTGEQLQRMLDRGDVDIGILVPHDFERRLAEGTRAAAQLLVNGSDPVLLGSARGLLGMPAPDIRLPPRQDKAVGLFEVRNFYNPERRSAVFVVPGLIGVILTMTLVLFTAVAVVRERERGNLEMLINTPVRGSELMVGKIIPYVVIGLIQVTLILLFGRLLFHVPVNGALHDVYLASVVFIASNLTLGLVISTFSKTQFQAMQMTIFFLLPSILLSGFMFPFDGMPRAAQLLAELLPLTHFVRLIRGVLLRGEALMAMSHELYALLAFVAVALLAATLRFKKRLD